ncbi:Uncharacterised protein [Streptococcus pneumoniae]|nr:Uncharacterised protein [Streptococcus pneumoniae]CKH27380.1 Uncharacterised protein [Streptococcus pneumoniae]COE54225.1 Uncharacterised protein [Streptococcus pneumoniae]
MPFFTFTCNGFGLSPSALSLPSTNSKLFGNSSLIFTFANFPCSTTLRNVIRYSTSSPNFGAGLFTVFSAFIFPFLYSGVIIASGFCGGFFGLSSSTIAVFTIFFPTFTASVTFTLNIMLRSAVSVIFSYFAVIFPASSFNSTGFGSLPSAFKLSFTYSNPFGS